MKRRAIAIAAVRANPFKEAADSARNFFALAGDKMYGTAERVRATVGVAILLTLMAMILASGDVQAFTTCAS